MDWSALFDGPIRVCFLIDNLKTGGVETQLLLLLRCLDRSNITPYLCLLDGTSKTSRRLEPPDCPVLRLGVRSLRHPSSLVKALRLARFFRREKIDALQLFFADSTYFGAPVAKLSGVSCIIRSRLDTGFWVRPIDRWLGRLYTRLVNATLVNCEASRRSVIADENAVAESIVFIPNGLDISQYETIAADPQLHQEGPCIGAVANLLPWKRLDLLLKATKSLSAVHPALKVKIAGEGPARAELEKLIEKLKLCRHVSLLGRVDDVPTLLRELDVAVLCSDTEGAPNAIVEYMAAARPIVVTDVGGNTELVKHERTGLVVPPNDADALAAAIDRLLEDRSLASRLAGSAREYALAEHSAEVYARRYENFYISLNKEVTGVD